MKFATPRSKTQKKITNSSEETTKRKKNKDESNKKEILKLKIKSEPLEIPKIAVYKKLSARKEDQGYIILFEHENKLIIKFA